MRDECLNCDCSFATGCKFDEIGKDARPDKRPYVMKTPRTRRGPYRLAKIRSVERDRQRELKSLSEAADAVPKM